MGCQWYNPSSYGSCANDVARSAAGDAFHSITESFGQAADHAVSWLWIQVNSASAVHLGGKGFDLELELTAAIAGVMAVGLFSFQIIQSVLRREPGGLARGLKGLVVAFIGGGLAIAVVDLLLAATDSLCVGVVKAAAGTNVAGLGRLILGGGALTSSVNGSAALLLLSLGCIIATVVVFGALVVRKVLIVVTAIFAPVAFAGSLADVTASWTRRWIETTIALVASKLILVLIFVAGYGILIHGVGQAGSGTGQKVTQVISGILVLFVAGFAPWMALKLVHFTGDHAHQLHSLGSSAVGGVSTGGRMAQKAAPYAARVAAPAAAAGAGASLAGSAAAGRAGPAAMPATRRGTGGPGGENGPAPSGGAPGGDGGRGRSGIGAGALGSRRPAFATGQPSGGGDGRSGSRMAPAEPSGHGAPAAAPASSWPALQPPSPSPSRSAL